MNQDRNQVSETNYQKLFRVLPAMAVLLSADLAVEDATDLFLEETSLDRTIIGKHFLDIFRKDPSNEENTDTAAIDKSLNKVLKTAQEDILTGIRYDLKGSDGVFSERYWNLRSRPILSASGHVAQIMHFTTDITGEVLAHKKIDAEIQKEKDVESALAEAANREEALLEGFTGASFELNAEWVVVKASGQLTKLAAQSAEEIIGRIVWDVFPGLVGSDFENMYRKAALEQRPETLTGYYPDLDTWFEVYVLPTRSAGLAVFFRDVSEKILDQIALQKSEALFRATQEASLDGFMVFEPVYDDQQTIEDFTFIYSNDAAANIVERRKEDLIGKKMLVELPGNRPEGLFDAYVRVVETGETFNTELQYSHDGIAVYLRVIAVKVDGGFAVTFADLSDRRRAEEALRQSEQQFRTVFENAKEDAIILSDADRVIQAWNPGAEYICGWKADEVIGTVADFLYENSDLEAGIPYRQVELLKTQSKVTFERWHKKKSGERFWCSGSMSTLVNADGSLRGYLKVFRDATARHEMEQRILQSNEILEERVRIRTKELEEANRELESFNYSIAHDLRAPLRAIVSTASLLKEDLEESLQEEHRKMLERQSYNAKRLARLIDDLLRLSRLGRVEVHREPIDMSAESLSVANELNPLREIDIQPGMKAEGDRTLVRTVLQNLIENAFKFSKQESTVQIGESDGVFWVKDEGIGFDMNYIGKLFKPFERLVKEDEFEGTGIGLANVDRIIRRHGGRAWAESDPGVGTTFFFTLA